MLCAAQARECSHTASHLVMHLHPPPVHPPPPLGLCLPQGRQASKSYNATIREATVRWGMLEMLAHPPVGFEEVVRTHFKLKKAEITQQVRPAPLYASSKLPHDRTRGSR